VIGLRRRAARSVDGCGRNRVGESSSEPRVARDVGRLLAGLSDTATNDLVYRLRLDAGARHDPLQSQAEQPGRMDTCQPAVSAPDRRPDRLDDDRLAPVHAPSPGPT